MKDSASRGRTLTRNLRNSSWHFPLFPLPAKFLHPKYSHCWGWKLLLSAVPLRRLSEYVDQRYFPTKTCISGSSMCLLHVYNIVTCLKSWVESRTLVLKRNKCIQDSLYSTQKFKLRRLILSKGQNGKIPEAIQKVFGLLAILKLQQHETCHMSLFDLGAPLKFSLFSFYGEY